MADTPAPRSSFGAILLVALLAAAACRDEERGVSGDSWDCLCVLETDDAAAEAWVCALSAGEASEIATTCLGGERNAAVRFCDCIESTQEFCDLGQCVVR
ncbi:MAG: hypothetical protein JRI23_23175 [Deltaproteobacteria bacterium]|jgi:hypothetical protein|nr:hypothetical protein [Deltaproteobacteria bacterium]MBW2534875.1 hypothetical protein [Deltaproteobacteria bacterium]